MATITTGNSSVSVTVTSNNVKYYSDAAQTYAKTATEAAAYAKQYAADAEAAAEAAETSEENAATSEENAENYAELAKDWATKTDDTVDGEEYSAKYYAQVVQEALEGVGVSAATESVAGIAQIATSDEMTEAVNDAKIVTPYKCAEYIASQGFASADDVYTKDETDSQIAASAVDLTDYYTKTETDEAITAALPVNLSTLNNDAGFITEDDIPTVVSAFTNDAGYITADDIPVNVSYFTNDAGYLTTVPDEYITETELTAMGYLTAVGDEYVTETELTTALEDKQDTLTFDTSPVSGSTNPVTSGGIYTAINNAINDYDEQFDDSDGVIASSSYLLTYLSSNYARASALTDLELSLTDYYTKDETDSAISTAISGIDVSVDLSDYYTKTETDTALAEKQDALTFDTTPTEYSTNPVTSGGVYEAIETYDTNLSLSERYITSSALTSRLSSYVKTSDLAAVATSGSYSDLSDTPTAVSSFTNDAGYLTESEVNTLITTAIGEIENGSY